MRSAVKQMAGDLWGIARLNFLYVWHCLIRRRPDRMMKECKREAEEIGIDWDSLPYGKPAKVEDELARLNNER